jgi:hypothetical protein
MTGAVVIILDQLGSRPWANCCTRSIKFLPQVQSSEAFDYEDEPEFEGTALTEPRWIERHGPDALRNPDAASRLAG